MKDEIIGNLDFPREGIKIYRPRMLVKGWAFLKNANDLSIEILVDGKFASQGIWGLARYDVYGNYKTEESYQSGYISGIDMKQFPDGRHEVKVLAKSSGDEKLLGIVNIVKGKKETSDKTIPRAMVPAGQPGQFMEFGEKYLQHFIKFGKLSPEHKVLEIGCGMGRLAMPLTKYLHGTGEYYSLDIIPQAIEHCQKNISTRYPNFHFTLSDIYNGMYNPNGKLKSSQYKFPYENDFFDFVFLGSVFTHMMPTDLENYLSEIARVLKKGAKCFITYFVLNEEQLQSHGTDFERLGMRHKSELFRTRNEKIPESAISYEEPYVRNLYSKFGLDIEEPIHYGKWQGTKNSLARQDIIIAIKN